MTSPKKPPTHTPKDSHYARLRRAHRDAQPPAPDDPLDVPEGRLRLYGLHTVRAALANSRRRLHRLWATRNGAERLDLPHGGTIPVSIEHAEPRLLDRLVGADAVHQGVVLETEPLPPKRLEELGKSPLVLVLDQVTDPHNVGAILRSAAAFGAGAVITTSRHSPQESGVLGKAASGALEHIDLVEVRNLADALETLAVLGFQSIGLDSDGSAELEGSFSGTRLALVLGAEGKGLRQKTRDTVSVLARLDMPGAIRSLNVSNAAAIALYAAEQFLKGQPNR